MKKMKRINLIVALLLAFISTSYAQNSDTISKRKDAINIFVSCFDCDMEYIKEKINFVNYVRDIKEADVVIIETSEGTGNGGDKYTLIFEGNNRFKGINDTLFYNSNADETFDELRKKDVKYLKIGLTKYVAHSPLVKNLEVNYNEKIETIIPQDKWNSWVFNIDGSANINAEATYSRIYTRSSLSADRITEKWKIENEISMFFSQSIFTFGDQKITSIKRNNSFRNLTVKSISDHWSAGIMTFGGNSTYTNKEFYMSSMPAIEYDLFPYSKSNIVQLRIQNAIGINYFDYYDTTIYNKTKETLYSQRTAAAFRINKKWGYINTSLSFNSYLHDFSKNSINISTSFNIRIFKGLTTYIYGNYSIIHDQLYLPKTGLTYEEILLQQQQNATEYSYWLMFGLSYTFGSIYNNVVNPRFDDIF